MEVGQWRSLRRRQLVEVGQSGGVGELSEASSSFLQRFVPTSQASLALGFGALSQVTSGSSVTRRARGQGARETRRSSELRSWEEDSMALREVATPFHFLWGFCVNDCGRRLSSEVVLFKCCRVSVLFGGITFAALLL